MGIGPDGDDVEDFLTFVETAINAASKVALTVIAMAVMVSIEPLLTLAVVLPLVTVAVVTRTARSRIRRDRETYRRASAAVTGPASQSLKPVTLID